MAGTMTIQRRPIALLDILGMKGTGDTPHLVAPDMQTVYDTTDLYLSDRMDNIQGAVVVGAATGFLPVPVASYVQPTECWFVYSLHAIGAAGVTAGATVKVQLAIYRASLGQYQLFNAYNSFIATEVVSLGIHFERPLLLRPGDRAAVHIYAFTGVPAFNINIYAFAARVSI